MNGQNITTMGPEKRLAVDNDALTWNPYNQRWDEVGKNTSKSKVTLHISIFKLAKRSTYEQG